MFPSFVAVAVLSPLSACSRSIASSDLEKRSPADLGRTRRGEVCLVKRVRRPAR